MRSWIDEINTIYDPWVVEGAVSGLTVLWGEPGIGKTFVAVSLAASVATGRPWLGRKCLQGDVVYVCGEGGYPSLARRIQAALANIGVGWLEMFDPEHDPETPHKPIPIHISPGVDLVAGPDKLLEEIGDKRPRLIIIDTLSRCFGGDENKQEFMQKFVQSLDLLREVYGCALLVLHHAGKNHDIRGSTVLAGAVDVSLKMTYGRGSEAKTLRILAPTKLRERELEGGSVYLRLVPSTIHDSAVERTERGLVINDVTDDMGEVLYTVVVKMPERTEQDVAKVLRIGKMLGESGAEFCFSKWHATTVASGQELSKPAFKPLVQTVLADPKSGVAEVYEDDPEFLDDSGAWRRVKKKGWFRCL